MAFDYTMTFGNCPVIPHSLISTSASDLRIAVYDSPASGTQVAFNVNPGLYDSVSGRDMSRRFCRVLDWAASAPPGGCVGDAQIMSGAERQQIVQARNDTAAAPYLVEI
jgi:hypothetical protein